MIRSELRDGVGVGVLTIDRDERRNALDIEHCDALGAAAAKLAAEGARALVITGAGSSFCSGADMGGVYGDGFRTALYSALRGITALRIPVLAAVNGPAVGAGTQLAIACDLRVASESAFFAVPTARNGLAVDPWTIRRLALLAGGGAAHAMLLGCDRVDAALAHQRGLVDRLGDTDSALRWAEEIAELAPLSLAYSKQALHTLDEPSTWEPLLDAAFDACWDSEDIAESKAAQAENRTPRFRGR